MVYKGPEYPPELTRLLRKGKATYAIGTGPLPDDTDWSKIKYAVLKEECGYRDSKFIHWQFLSTSVFSSDQTFLEASHNDSIPTCLITQLIVSSSGTVETLRQVLTDYKEPEKLPPAEDSKHSFTFTSCPTCVSSLHPALQTEVIAPRRTVRIMRNRSH